MLTKSSEKAIVGNVSITLGGITKGKRCFASEEV